MAKIETQNLQLKTPPKGFGPLSEMQQVYLESLIQGRTIAQTVEQLLAQGRLPHFAQLYALIEQLHAHKLISNPIVDRFFAKIREHESPPAKSSLMSGLFKKEKAEEYLKRHPFFRSQSPTITAMFSQRAEVVEVKPGTVLCQTGHMERDLIFMIEGEAAIYKTLEGQGRKLLGFFGKDAVIGEVGFFMGELRTADVVVTKPSKIVIVRYDEATFGRAMNKDIAKSFQVRFRVVHALAKSQFLKNIPEFAMDSLLSAGKVRQAKEFEPLCRENEQGDSCFIVIQGSIVISRGPKTVGVLGPGDAFGEIALFFTQGRRTATAMAQRDTSLLEIPAKDFYRLLGENLLLAREFEKLALERAGKDAAAA